MPCQDRVIIGKNLTFSITTHDWATGVLTDADSDPTYRIYEDDTATAILTGTMSTLDPGNTTGFYAKKIPCSVASGFEIEKTYTIYITATVNGKTGGISYAFSPLAPGLIFLHFYPRINLELSRDVRITKETQEMILKIRMENSRKVQITKGTYSYANTNLSKQRILKLPILEEEQ